MDPKRSFGGALPLLWLSEAGAGGGCGLGASDFFEDVEDFLDAVEAGAAGAARATWAGVQK